MALTASICTSPVLQVPGLIPISYWINNKQVYLRVQSDMPISRVKDMISANENVAADTFHLTLRPANNRLDNYTSVNDSGITVDAQLSCACYLYPLSVAFTADFERLKDNAGA